MLASRVLHVLILVGLTSGSVSSAPSEGATTPPQQEKAFEWIDQNHELLRQLNRLIWECAEVGLEEHRSSEALSSLLKEHGFKVEHGVADMPTAFIATYGSGKPVVAILAEFDALPGMSQEAKPVREAREKGGCGHACGHSVFGVASVGAAVAARHAMEEYGLTGTLRLYGTPAEETGIGKSYMVQAGMFRDCDVALHWHPGDRNKVSFSLSKAVLSVKYTFEGLPAHASLSPHDGRSALDAVELMNIAANYLREHLKEDTRIHYVITDGGGQPNVVPPKAQVWYYLRANDHADAEHIFARMEKIAEGAALMTDTRLSLQVESDSHELLPNWPLSQLIYKNLKRVGPPQFSRDERKFAKRSQAPLVEARGKHIDKPLADLVDPLQREPELIKASTDVGDVSWVVPTSGFRTACYTYGAPGHSWQIVACTGMSIGEKGLYCAAKVLSGTALDLFMDPALVKAARRDFEQRSEGKPFHTLIPPGQKPPTKIR